MFNSITWEFFTTSIISLVAGYYFITTFLLFRKEIVGWVRSHRENASFKSLETPDDKLSISVMGNILNDKEAHFRSTISSSEDVNVFTHNEQPETIQVTAERNYDCILISSVGDLIQEIKSLIELVSECKSDKTECVSLFRTLFLRYPHLLDTPYFDSINLYVIEVGKTQFSFDLSLNEVSSWWKEDSSMK